MTTRTTPRHHVIWSFLSMLCALNTTGCGDQPDPPHYLQNLRILAAEVTPQEADTTTTLDLRAFLYLPADEKIVEESWSFCPVSLGPYAQFACIDASCEFCVYHAGDVEEGSEQICTPGTCGESCQEEVEESRTEGNCQTTASTSWRPTLTVNPWEYFMSCFGNLGGDASSFGGQGMPSAGDEGIPENVDILFRYRARTDTGLSREALVRVPFWPEGAPEKLNLPPDIKEVSVNDLPLNCGDELPAVGTGDEVVFKIRIEESSLDVIPTPDGSGERVEDVFVTFFCTAGRFERELTDGVESESTWSAKDLEEGQTEAEIYMVVRDEGGGQKVLGPYKIPITGK